MKKLRQNNSIIYSKDLSSFGIWQTLTDLISKALSPLINNTNVGVELGLSCTSLTSTRARKIAYKEAPDMLPTMFWITLKAHKKQLNTKDITDTGLERNIIADHISLYLGEDYEVYFIDKNKLKEFVSLAMDDYYKFRKDVANRYLYLVESLANRQWSINRKHGLLMEKEAMQNIFYIAAYRGIDKFIPSKGTLTSYIQQWLVAGRSSKHLTFDNEAVTLDRLDRHKIHFSENSMNNKSIPIEDRENELIITPSDIEDTFIIKHIAKHKYSTLFFLISNLDYPLSKKEKESIYAWNNRRSSFRAEGTGDSLS